MPIQTDLHFTFDIGEASCEVHRFTLPEGLPGTIPLEVERTVHFGKAMERAR